MLITEHAPFPHIISALDLTVCSCTEVLHNQLQSHRSIRTALNPRVAEFFRFRLVQAECPSIGLATSIRRTW